VRQCSKIIVKIQDTASLDNVGLSLCATAAIAIRARQLLAIFVVCMRQSRDIRLAGGPTFRISRRASQRRDVRRPQAQRRSGPDPARYIASRLKVLLSDRHAIFTAAGKPNRSPARVTEKLSHRRQRVKKPANTSPFK
jgi:hypothetical protein